MRRFLLTAALAIPLFAGAAAAPATQAVPLPQATCTGVWVVVDFGSLGGTSTTCATSYSTGTAALKSAGFSPSLDGGMVLKIGGKPSSPDINKAYWSYWHATVSGDGSYSGWSYSTLGAGNYHPTKGNAEGWRYQSLSDGQVPPGIKPPVAASEPTPTPTATKTIVKPKPTATPTKSASASAKAPATTKAPRTPSASTASGTASATAPAGATVPASAAVPTPTPEASTDTGASTDAAAESVTSPEPTGNGSPLGAIVAGSAVLVAGAGLGGWWLWKGRRP